jgi:Putative S-adenosyl-L-methionine-dependent methyltransferase
MDLASRPGWRDTLLETARRLGPRPYSEYGPNPAPPLPPAPQFAARLVDEIDGRWVELGCPDPFTLVEIGAGDGTRAAAFLARGPACLTALRYVLVEDDPAQRDQQRTHLPLESPIMVLGPVGPADQDDDDDLDGDSHPLATVGIGPLLTSLPEPPVVDGDALIVAAGSVSRLPSDRLEWRDGRWWEIRLAADQQGALSELPVPLDQERAAGAEQLAGSGDHGPRPEGARYALLKPAVDWLGGTLRIAGSGRLLVIDRWTDVTRPLARGEAPPLAYDQLAAVRRPLEAAPVGLFPGVSMVSWRLG